MQPSAVLLTASLLLAGPPELPKAPVQTVPVQVAPDTVRLSTCVLTIINAMQVPAEQPGVLASLEVQEGDEVMKDQLLAQIKDDDAQLRMKATESDWAAAKKQAEKAVRVEAAVASYGVADFEWRKAIEVNRKSPTAISELEVKKLELAREHALLQIELAKVEFATAEYTAVTKENEFYQASNEVRDRRILAPWDGVISERLKRKGEWLQQGEPFLRMIQMDHLHVEGFLNIAEVAPLEVDGCEATIMVRLSRGRTESFEGKITFVSPTVEAGQYRVWAEVANIRETDSRGKQQWLLRPGMTAEMSIQLATPKVTATPANKVNLAKSE